MRQIYSQLSTLTFQHQYFRDNLFRTVDVSFDESSARILNNLGIVIKRFHGSVNVLASDLQLLENEMGPIRLYLNCNDPYFINYTELPDYNPSGNLIYFNNLTANSGKNSGEVRLHTDEFVGINDIVSLTQGKISIPEFDAKKQYRFVDATQTEIPSQNVIPSFNTGDFLISGPPEGIIYILADNNEFTKYYFQPKAVWVKPFGVIELYPGNLFTHFSEQGKVNYLLNFKNRQTIWKYFFLNPVYQKFNNLSIISKGKQQIFNAPQKQPVLENQEALVIESKNAIPLSEFSDETYQLVDNYDPELRSGKVIHKSLAKASPEQLYVDTTQSDALVYSHIYIKQ